METLTIPPPAEQTPNSADVDWDRLEEQFDGEPSNTASTVETEIKHRRLARLNLIKKLSRRFGRHAIAVDPKEQKLNDFTGNHIENVKSGRFKGRFKKVAGNTAVASGVAEAAGIGVDVLLMGGGSAGINILKSIPVREGIAIGPDVAIIQRIQRWAHNKEGHEVSEQDTRKKIKAIGSLAVTAAVAIAAQKAGLGVVEHVNEHNSALHFIAPLTTKVGAVTAARRVFRL